jgi:actin-related protein
VDVGDQKTSVSCVEDGISHPETRIHLDYGGADVTQVPSLVKREITVRLTRMGEFSPIGRFFTLRRFF